MGEQARVRSVMPRWSSHSTITIEPVEQPDKVAYSWRGHDVAVRAAGLARFDELWFALRSSRALIATVADLARSDDLCIAYRDSHVAPKRRRRRACPSSNRT